MSKLATQPLDVALSRYPAMYIWWLPSDRIHNQFYKAIPRFRPFLKLGKHLVVVYVSVTFGVTQRS